MKFISRVRKMLATRQLEQQWLI